MWMEDFASHYCLIQKKFRRIGDRVPSRDKTETENNTQVAEGLVQLIRQKIRQLGTRLGTVLPLRNTEEEVPRVKPELFQRSCFAANERERCQS
jgi:hypothetical protein